MENKKIPVGVKIICIALIFVILSGFFRAVISAALLNLPQKTKIEWLQTNKDELKLLNITTVEQFDGFHKKNVRITLKPFNIFIIMVSLILFFGLLKLKNWARIGMITFSGFALLFNIYFLWSHLPGNASELLGKVISLPFHFAIVIYFINSKVEKQFRLD